MMRNKLKKRGAVFSFLFLLALTGRAGAEEQQPRLGISAEVAMNRYKNCVFGHALAIEFNLFDFMANGVSFNVSHDFTVTTVLEPSLFARKYFLNLFFAQFDLGMSIGVEKSAARVTALAGLSGGFQCLLAQGDYVLEPYIKAGYPFIFGVGLRIGSRL